MDIFPHSNIDVRGLSRTELESLVLQTYANGDVSEEEARRLLGFESRFQVHAFLKDHGAYLNYGPEDLEEDLKFVDSWLSSRKPRR
jgi:predicted HTH domain antitoxin